MDRRIGMLMAALSLAGCVGTRMEKGLSTLTGATIQMVMTVLGPPDDERSIAGQHIYVWATDHQSFVPLNGGFMPAQAYCTIQLTVDSHDVVTRWQYSGNAIGCRAYASELSR